MNSKDYKAIAEIIKRVSNIPVRTILAGSERLFGYDKAIKDISNRLADYFEKEQNDSWSNKVPPREILIKHNLDSFDRQQFLKDCGVE